MHVHFVCTGNVYRSRLAEAYLKSKDLPDVIVSSSGTEAEDNNCGPICWYAQRIIEASGLVRYMSPVWRQTDKTVLMNSDIVIFMEKSEHDYARKNCDFDVNNYVIWGVPDLDEIESLDFEETIEMAKQSQDTFEVIKSKVDKLAADLLAV